MKPKDCNCKLCRNLDQITIDADKAFFELNKARQETKAWLEEASKELPKAGKKSDPQRHYP